MSDPCKAQQRQETGLKDYPGDVLSISIVSMLGLSLFSAIWHSAAFELNVSPSHTKAGICFIYRIPITPAVCHHVHRPMPGPKALTRQSALCRPTALLRVSGHALGYALAPTPSRSAGSRTAHRPPHHRPQKGSRASHAPPALSRMKPLGRCPDTI